MIYSNEEDLLGHCRIEIVDGRVEFKDLDFFKEKTVENLIDTILLSDSIHLKNTCHWIAYEAAHEFGIIPSSIQTLYEARAKHNLAHFTVPAINLRTLTYDSACSIFRAAKKIDAGAFIFEIARSEIGYTEQRPREYFSCIILAAVKEGFSGPVFLQGDHFQVNAKNFLQDRKREIDQLKDLITEAVEAGFYNIDIDSSTLVDLSKPTTDEQQKLNYEICALLTRFIREILPDGVKISIGGEIGEVGGQNSTPEELTAFMQGYNSLIKELTGLSKISIQTGTSHGGVVLPDGSIAQVKIDFDTLKALSQIARIKFKMAGAVQHGASTLPKAAFSRFPDAECAEIHLATQFQNIIYDYFPIPFRDEIYTWLHKNLSDERGQEQTDEQFIYKTRKKALGPFKRQIHSLPQDLKHKISSAFEKEVSFLFEKLHIKDTRSFVDKYVKSIWIDKKKKDFF
jgi:fructose/tagatose bisphosphate aldolase